MKQSPTTTPRYVKGLSKKLQIKIYVTSQHVKLLQKLFKISVAILIMDFLCQSEYCDAKCQHKIIRPQ